jgi:molecular chaperone GrpE
MTRLPNGQETMSKKSKSFSEADTRAAGDELPADAPAAATPDAAPAAGTEAAAPVAVPPEDELTTLRREIAELRDQNLRLMAELQNQQKRALREKHEAQRFAGAELGRDLLVVLDDLARAEEAARQAPGGQAVADGVRIMAEHFLKVLGNHHIRPIEAVGRPFDPTYHEAVLQQRTDEHPPGVVLQEITRGYTMHERVLRPSRVIVSGQPAGAGSAPPGEAEK